MLLYKEWLLMTFGTTLVLCVNLSRRHFAKARNLCNSYITDFQPRAIHDGVCALAPPRLRAPNNGIQFPSTLTAPLSAALATSVALFTYISDAVHLRQRNSTNSEI